jgi:predicted ATPase/DNA-binding SARP family transcriptional activator
VLELGVLGPVRAVRDGREVELGGPKPRAVLALLLVDAGRVVPAEYLAEVLWRGSPPPGAAKTLRSYVSRLRSLLDPEVALVARGGGYALSVEPDRVDAARFERLVAAGREALGRGAAAAAAGGFGAALGLWRGRALADVGEVEPLALEAARLEELRLVAVEGRAEADIERGLAGEVTGELERLVAEYPVRERLWRLLVLALYRAERQADALAAYRRARELLAEELGIEPGEGLRALEQAVLRQEVPAMSPPARHNLPVRLTSFVGREGELAVVGRLVGEARLVTLTGAGGAGKTRLAVEFATGAVERFGDGVWLADLAGLSDAGLVPSVVMEALGVRQSGEAPAMEALRWRLRSAELLLVLDNCEHLLGACADLAAAVLGSAPGLRVLATSREPLGVPGEAAYPVPPLAVPPELSDPQALAGAAAVRLFLARAASARADAGVQAAPVAVVARICRELDGLPLAIELAAARASVLSAEEIAAHLTDKFRFLAYRQPVADPRHQALKAAIGWSYDLLSAEQRRAFRSLSVFAGGFSLTAMAVVCCGGDQAAALDLLDQLVSKSLVVAEPTAGGTRYRMLETIRQYAAGQLAEAGEAGPARRRHAEAFLPLAEEERGLPVLLREQDNFRAALEHTLTTGGGETGPRLARALGEFWLARGLLQEARGWLERALAAGPAGPRLRADLFRLLGAVLYAAGDRQRAQAVLAQGAQVAAAAGLSPVQARIRVLRAEIQAGQDGNLAWAIEACEESAAVLESAGDLEGVAEAWLSAGRLRFWAGAAGAADALERAAACARQGGNHHAEQESKTWLAAALWNLPIPVDVAVGRAERLLEAAAGDPWEEAAILHPLSLTYGYAGRFAEARAACRRAQSILTASGAKLDWARCVQLAGRIELMAGDAAAAEQNLREGYEALHAMGERGDRANIVTLLAEAAYAQGRFDEALRLTEEGEALAGAGDFDAQGRWRATRAKVLARRGQFRAAARLAEEAVALVPAACEAPERAEFLVAQAEVARLAGAVGQAEDSLRRALQFYQDRRMVALAGRTRALLASLTGPASHPH